MNNAKSISTGDSLIKTCTWVLDAIYSCYDCVEFIEQLQLIERKLSNNDYKDLHSFTTDVLEKIPQVTNEFIESIDLSDIRTLPEEYSNTPIYSSIQLRKESKMYTVNIKSHQKLHSSIYTAIEQPTSNLHRLYVKDKKFVLEARDSIHSIVSLFFDVQTQISNENQEITCIKAKVATVHILGEYHPTATAQFDGWIKIKIVHTNTINTKLPTRLAHRLFDKREQIIRKIVTKQSENNELIRQFTKAVMNSHTEHFQINNAMPLIENRIGKENSKDTPKTRSDRKLSKGSASTNQTQSTTSSTSSSSKPEPIFSNFWSKLENFTYERNAEMVHESKYGSIIKRKLDASGYFKHVYFNNNDVLQVFQRSTDSQRVLEIASLLALKDQPCIGRIKEVIYTDTEIIGLTMDRYDMTLKDYLHKHTHRRLTGEERMHIITQMLKSINVSHQAGIAHRDLSTVNFMMNKDDTLYLIDFGKAVFFFPRDAKKWWVDSDEDNELYQEDVKPATREELAVWCRNLPYVMARPDHGYRFYRSIQTLPRSQRDHELLPHLIDPAAEDIFSLGTMIWKIFSGIEPWPGVFDTDLKHLRETVGKDSKIDHMLDRSMPGPMSKKFLQKFLRVHPEDRKTAANILNWIQREDVKQALIEEWSVNNGSRRTAARNNVHCKSQAQIQEELVHPVIKIKLPKSCEDTDARRPIGRPRVHPKEEITNNSPKRPIGRPRLHPKAEETIDTTPKRPIGRPRKSTPSSSTQPSSEYNSTNSSSRYVVTEDGIKRFAKTNIPVGRPQTSSKLPIVKQEHYEASLGNVATPRPTVVKKYPSTYVPTGKPRGRPKKKQHPSLDQNKTAANEINDDTTSTESITDDVKKPEQAIDQKTLKANEINDDTATHETENIANSIKKPEQSTIQDITKANSTHKKEAQTLNSPVIKLITKPTHTPIPTAKSAISSQGSKRPGEDLEMHSKKRKVTSVEPTNKDKVNSKLFIKLPEQPKSLLTKETIQLVSRGTLANVREPNKSTKIVRLSSLIHESDRFSAKKISPPPQSPLLSPTSNTSSTAEDASSPPSPLPSKRKFEYEDDKNNKRRNIQSDQDVQNSTDEFDVALFNILQGLNMKINRP